MKTLAIYDPPMCCSTGVCGTDVDPRLIQLASDIAWLQSQGVSVARYNLAQQPAAFVANPAVAAALQKSGNDCLPLVVVDGEIATRSIYPTRDQLADLLGLSSGCCGEGADCCSEDSDCCGDDSECCEEKEEKSSGCCGGGNSSCC